MTPCRYQYARAAIVREIVQPACYRIACRVRRGLLSAWHRQVEPARDEHQKDGRQRPREQDDQPLAADRVADAAQTAGAPRSVVSLGCHWFSSVCGFDATAGPEITMRSAPSTASAFSPGRAVRPAPPG
jgi:hypothetical protein